MIKVKDNNVYIETKTLTAVVTNGLFTSIKSKQNGEEYITGVDPDKDQALQLVYGDNQTEVLDKGTLTTITTHSMSDHCAEIRIESWFGNGIIALTEDRENGDLIVEPSAYSARPGVLACRWNLCGIRKDLELVAPLYQGIKLKLDDPLINNTRWRWPVSWEAGFSILQGKDSGFWIYTKDTQFRYKTLNVGSGTSPYTLGLDTEAYGPIDNNLSAGGLSWRINTYTGSWHKPASLYKEWLWQAYDLEKARKKRPDWIYDLKMAVSWCPTDIDILYALKEKVDPKKVLIHVPHWRTDKYDQNYPSYKASEKGREFIRKGIEMGFHMMPHFNAMELDPSNPNFVYLKDFVYRDINTKRYLGWAWINRKSEPVPQSHSILQKSREYNVMTKIHPGARIWRSILGDNMLEAVAETSTNLVFIDISHNTYNLHNCLVNNMTPTEGVKELIDYLAELKDGLLIGGEGLNEITMQGHTFAQVHLFQSSGRSIPGLERTGGCDINNYIFGDLCKSFGYSGLNGATEYETLRMRIHEEHGAIPTITMNKAEEVINPNNAFKRIFDNAK
jgi:hypothetical protein